jgi:predicted ATPase/DNA-binding SARP family transcriptional activator
MLEVRLLGTFSVKYKNKVVDVLSRSAQSLFAYLILSAGTAHRREKLAGLFWPDSLEETARDNLRHALWRLRKALQSVSATIYLQANDLTVTFNTSAEYSLDAAALAGLGKIDSTEALISVLSCYQGELLPGFYDEWVLSEREHLHSIFEHHMARLMSLLQQEQRWLDVLEWAERWIKLGRKPEPAYRALMTAHAAGGNMSKVVESYERCVKALLDSGVEPSEETQQLLKELKGARASSKEVSISSKPFPQETVSTIPVPLTSFVGREREMKEIFRLLATSHLLTLTGPGGVGKTRLAIQIASGSFNRFKDGVLWVGLTSLPDGDLIPQEIAQLLDIRPTPQESLVETLINYLRSKDVLLVLDNCEHLIGACAQVAERLLGVCPRLKILATSIEALGIFNEKIWRVPSLPLPEIQEPFSLDELKKFASIELFAERASHASSDFILNEKNATSVARICQRLDGIPLALELAAARTRFLAVDEILVRLTDRFSLLTAGSRTAVPRHHTLRATIDWSHDLLTEPERILFRRLAVFAGGFTLEAVESVCSQEGLKRSEILDLLGRLVDKSLVIVEPVSGFPETRYRQLETIRHYALEKLTGWVDEARSIRHRHLEFFVQLAEKAEPHAFGAEARTWFKRVEVELDNFRTAMEWGTNTGQAVSALRIGGSLVYIWFVHGPLLGEWHDRIQDALSHPEGMKKTKPRAKALNGIGFMYWADMVPTDKRTELEEALQIGYELADRRSTATTLRNLGLLASIQGKYQEGLPLLEGSLDLWRKLGAEGKMDCAWTLTFLGDATLNLDEAERARVLYEEAVSIWREHGDLNFLAYSLRRLGQLAWHEARYEKAMALCTESLNLNLAVGDRRGTIACLAGFTAIAVAQERWEWAARLASAIENQLDSIGIRLLQLDKAEFEHSLSCLPGHLGEKKLQELQKRGRLMSLDEAIAFALGTK